MNTKKICVLVTRRVSILKLLNGVALPDDSIMPSFLPLLTILWNTKLFYHSSHKSANLCSDVIYILTWAILLHGNYQYLTVYVFVCCFSKVLLIEKRSILFSYLSYFFRKFHSGSFHLHEL